MFTKSNPFTMTAGFYGSALDAAEAAVSKTHAFVPADLQAAAAGWTKTWFTVARTNLKTYENLTSKTLSVPVKFFGQ